MDSIHSNFSLVAIYLRKSRGESEKDLDNHRNTLIEVCKRGEWDYDIFEEIASGESLELRPKAQELFNYIRIEPDSYDAVLVMDIDRLSRAGTSDSDYIKKILVDSNTFLVIKDRIMDLSNEQDDITYDMQSFFAKFEYKMIKKRLRQGKFQNAQKGYWTNGSPPLPYTYNKETRVLEIDETMRRTYRYIIDAVVINGKPTNQIAYELNQKGWLTAGRKGQRFWNSKTVRDILLDKTHLQYEVDDCHGCIVIGKTKGNAHRKKSSYALAYKRIPEEKWLVFKGLHDALKTQEEHAKIEEFLKRKTKAPRKTTSKIIYPLSGLIKCSFCGHYLGFTERADRKGLLSVKKCWYKDPYGNKCRNESGSMLLLVDKIREAIEKFIAGYQYEIDDDSFKALEEEIKAAEERLVVKDKAIERIDEAYEAGAYTLDELKIRKSKLRREKDHILENKQTLELKISSFLAQDKAEKVDILKEFRQLINNPKLTYEEQNELYKTIIDHVLYTKINGELTIQIIFK